MKDGLYHVAFSAGGVNAGQGIVVIKGGSVNGGDDGYTYTGTKTDTGGATSASLRVKRWNAATQSVFGDVAEFGLEMKGEANDAQGRFVLNGHVTGNPAMKISISGRFLVPAA